MSRLRVVNGAAILRADPASAPAVSEALIEGASAATYLSFLQHDWADGEADSVILAISRGADASLRLASVWYVAGRLLMNAKVSDDILRGLSAAPSPGANWENFGRELMARQLDPRRDRGAWHPVVETGGPAADSIAVFADSPLFTKKERSALRKRRSAAGKGDARIPWSGLTSKVSAGPSTVRWPVPRDSRSAIRCWALHVGGRPRADGIVLPLMRLPRIVPAKRANLRSSLLRPVHIALLLGALLFPAVAEAQNPPPAAVETPVEPPKFTPGEAALLVLAVKEPATQTKLTYALRDADPRVRAVAARIAAVTRSMGQLPALLRALPGETDAVAAREITRALVMLQDEQADATLRPLLVKLGPGAITGYGDIVARKRPGVWLELLPELVKVREAHRELGRITALAVRFRPEGGAAAGAAVAAHGSTALLDALLAEGGDDSGIEAFLTAASGTSDSAMRERVVWFVTRRTLVGQAFPPALLGELAEQRSAERSWEAFGRELLARSGVRRGAPTSWADVLEAHPDEAKRLAPHRESELFTKDERASLARFGVEALPRRPMSGPAPGVPSPDPPRIRTAEWILPGLLGDVLRAAGCRPLPDTSRLVADVTYRPNGTIARASVGADKLSPECQRAAFTGVSLSLSLPRAPHITDDPTPILLSFDPETVACLAEEPDSAPDMPSRLGADVTTPTGIRRVNPVYPAEAQRQRIQGVIILEAALSRRGCVTHAEVLRSIPFLDLPALVAVTQWQYAPIEREGRPVPVILTVAVNFMLKPR